MEGDTTHCILCNSEDVVYLGAYKSQGKPVFFATCKACKSRDEEITNKLIAQLAPKNGQ